MGPPASPFVQSAPRLAQGLMDGNLIGGRYRVLRALKAGGMGSVYEAEHQGTQRHVALKVIRPELVADPEARRRFETEARIGAVLASRHVVDVLDAGIDETTGMPFIAMELLPGCDLEELARRRGRFSPQETLTYLQQLARALDRAHGRGIVHRDLKPENLFLANLPDEEPHIKILDFGIAKLLHQYAGSSTNQVTGTPLYMAPEQAQRAADISPATDIWALGLIAYRLLVGRTYWDVDTIHALYAAILIHPLVSPTESAKGSGVPLPPGFDGWFFGCVHRDPAQRFRSAGQAVAALACLYGTQAEEFSNPVPRGRGRYEPVAVRPGQLAETVAAVPARTTADALAPTAAGPLGSLGAGGPAPVANGGYSPGVQAGFSATSGYRPVTPPGHGEGPLGLAPFNEGPARTVGDRYAATWGQPLPPGVVHPTVGHAPEPRRMSPMAAAAIVAATVVAGLLVAVVVVLLRSGNWGGLGQEARDAHLVPPALDGVGLLGPQSPNATSGADQTTVIAPLAQPQPAPTTYTPLLRYRSPRACPGSYWVQVAVPADATPDNYDFALTRKAISGHRELAGCCFVMARNPVGKRIFGGIAPTQASALRLKEVLDEKIGSHGRAIQSKTGLTILHGTFFLDELGNPGYFAEPL